MDLKIRMANYTHPILFIFASYTYGIMRGKKELKHQKLNIRNGIKNYEEDLMI